MSEPLRPSRPRRLCSMSRSRTAFPVRGFLNRRVGTLRALDDVSFSVQKGEVLGIVGESGCGKSTLGKTLMGIHQPTQGEVHLAGERIAAPGQKRAPAVRAKLQYVYQDPGASLDPRWTLRRSLHEPLIIHTDWSRAKREEHVQAIVKAVGCRRPISTSTPMRSAVASSAASVSPAFSYSGRSLSSSTSRPPASTSPSRRPCWLSFATSGASST